MALTQPKRFGWTFDAYKLNKVDCARSAVDDRQMDTPTVKDYIDTRFETLTAMMQMGFANIDAKFACVDAQFAVADSRLATVAAELRTEMHKGFVDLMKWFLATMIALFVALVAVMGFMFTNLDARISDIQASLVRHAAPNVPPPVVAPRS